MRKKYKKNNETTIKKQRRKNAELIEFIKIVLENKNRKIFTARDEKHIKIMQEQGFNTHCIHYI